MKGCRVRAARAAVCGVVAGVMVAASVATPGPALADPSTAFTAGEALVVGGTGKSVPSASMMHALYEQGIFSDPDPTGVQYPAQLWPIRGKLTLDESVAVGVANLDSALVGADGPVTVVGLSQGAVVVNYEKRALMAQPDPPADISFVTIGDPTNSDGGLLAKLPHVHIPILDATIPRAPVETPYDTTEIVHEYDGYSDFPDNPLNLLADLNALAGVIYLHPNKGGVDLNDPRNVVTSSTNSLGGTTTRIVVPTDELPLTRPLRALGVPDAAVDALDKPLRKIINTAYAGERPGRKAPRSGLGSSPAHRSFEPARRPASATAHSKPRTLS
ncbi:PE-PPE domain-containing protein [Mycolicibacterium pallens]|uniref:PE-PPE domain-containing protein n=1 Tax=Mycolicibacterium pallens TaxID=370524 RepID=A0ABX8VIH2_9MYCO|nr:PE-PPE domain-containing protein [Mycolicibacterium pallens]QYL17497.1 PE-PPE domain-containing protein [Mycolicibacterium pallens]